MTDPTKVWSKSPLDKFIIGFFDTIVAIIKHGSINFPFIFHAKSVCLEIGESSSPVPLDFLNILSSNELPKYVSRPFRGLAPRFLTRK